MVDVKAFADGKPKTRRIYLEDSYIKKLETSVIAGICERGRKCYVILEETIFHPQGGGQPSDAGEITGENFKLSVKKVLDVNDVLIHYGILEQGELMHAGERVELSIDWNRRYSIMKAHTAGHILDYAVNAVMRKYVETISASHSPEGAYVVYKIENDDPLDLEKVELVANEAARACRAVRVVYISREELFSKLNNVPNLERLPVLSSYRIISIDGINSIPCSGTHVMNTCEINEIEVLGKEKVQGGIALHYKVV
ncbi:MAG: alanyl-tRNA editing protein [Fervidicoccaceae archaeon]